MNKMSFKTRTVSQITKYTHSTNTHSLDYILWYFLGLGISSFMHIFRSYFTIL